MAKAKTRIKAKQWMGLLWIGSMLLAIMLGSGIVAISSPVPAIAVNQVGYLPQQAKVALLINGVAQTDQPVDLIDSQTKAAVLQIQPSPPKRDPSSRDWVQTLDFSDLSEPGIYYLQQGDLQSYPFEIGPEIYHQPFVQLLRSYYLQRCGVELQDPVTGISHPPCHLLDGTTSLDDGFHTAGQQLPATGGWHDAGDYGKYVATTTVTIGRLLNLYETAPQLFADGQLQIPESGNDIPDLLDEVKVGLDWLLTMQRSDGAVYRKLSGQNWPQDVAPQDDTQTRMIYGISTSDTAKFAAALAQAARVYRELQPEMAQRYLDAAQNAWSYLQSQRRPRVDERKQDDQGSGRYLYSSIDSEPSLLTDDDDKFWAAHELFLTTGTAEYQAYVVRQINRLDYTLFEWKDPSALAMSTILFDVSRSRSAQYPDAVDRMVKAKLLARADAALQTVKDSRYHIANSRWIWGSNKLAAEEGITLFLAYRLTAKPAYLSAAIDQLDYVLGRNPFNQSFVSGVGTHAVKHVNHIFARSQNIKIPGLFVGGPNTMAQDNIAPKDKGLLSYVDDDRSYSTNEYAIDYNASLIGLIGMVINLEISPSS